MVGLEKKTYGFAIKLVRDKLKGRGYAFESRYDPCQGTVICFKKISKPGEEEITEAEIYLTKDGKFKFKGKNKNLVKYLKEELK